MQETDKDGWDIFSYILTMIQIITKELLVGNGDIPTAKVIIKS